MGAVLCTAGEGSVVSFSAFWVTILALGATVLTAWGGYGKNSQVGLSLKRVGPLPAVKVCTCVFPSVFSPGFACTGNIMVCYVVPCCFACSICLPCPILSGLLCTAIVLIAM